MEASWRPDFGVCAAADVQYLRTGGARAAAVLAADAAFTHVLVERTAVLPQEAPCRSGQFYLRELPPLRAVLADLDPSWATFRYLLIFRDADLRV